MTETLFGFQGTDLRETFPEIHDCDEFKRLTKEELVFSWYFANRTSPYYTIPKAKRIVKCIGILKDNLSDDDFNRYVDLKFPAHIQNALDKMESFDPKLRSVAKMMTSQIVENLRKAVAEDIDNYTEANHKKAFSDMLINIGKNLPDLIVSLERGFGISKEKVKEIDDVKFSDL